MRCEREGIYTEEHIWTECWFIYFGVKGGRLPFRLSPAWVPRPKPGPVVHKDPVTWVKVKGASPHSSRILWEWQAGVTLVPSWYPIKHHLSLSGFGGCLQHYCSQTEAFPYELNPGHKKSMTKYTIQIYNLARTSAWVDRHLDFNPKMYKSPFTYWINTRHLLSLVASSILTIPKTPHIFGALRKGIEKPLWNSVCSVHIHNYRSKASKNDYL